MARFVGAETGLAPLLDVERSHELIGQPAIAVWV